MSPPPGHGAGKEIGVDLLHHGVYAAATSAVYEMLDPHRRGGRRHR